MQIFWLPWVVLACSHAALEVTDGVSLLPHGGGSGQTRRLKRCAGCHAGLPRLEDEHMFCLAVGKNSQLLAPSERKHTGFFLRVREGTARTAGASRGPLAQACGWVVGIKWP